MKAHAKRFLVAIAAILPLLSGTASAQAAAARGGFELDGSAAAGFQLTDVSGSNEKFQEYGEVGDGFVIDHLRLRYQRPASADFLNFDVRDANQRDQSYVLTVGRAGKYRFSAEYDAAPHRFSAGTFLWGGFGTGRLQISDVAQAQLEANETTRTERSVGNPTNDPNFDPAPAFEDAAAQGIVRGLYSAAPGVSYGLDRKRVGAALEVNLSRDATAWVRVRNENRSGARVINAGSYERWATGANLTHTQDRFVVLGTELAEPLDYRTFGASAGAGIRKESWLADVEYTFTQFRNFESALLWDNPFRVTDAATLGAPAANAFDRARYAVGQIVLPPDSVSHDITASGAVDLPMHGRLAASLSYGIITQDEAFQPYTRNTAIIATDGAGTPVGSAATAALPAADLDGDVRTIAGTLSATVRPLTPVTVAAKYRVYRYDGETAEISWPGYAAFGESVWRRRRNDPSPDGLFKNEVFDYWRHEADLGIDYKLSRMVSLGVEGGWEGWRFDHLRLDKLDEYFAGAGVTVRPARNASLKATYRYADRSADGYLRGNTAQNPEARGLMNFNWSDRKRHVADARIHYSPSRMVSLGLLGSFSDEEYDGKMEGGTAIDDFRFGRTDLTRWIGSADVTVTPAERLSFQVSYTRENRKEKMANGAKDDGPKATDDFGFADAFSPDNYWNSDIEDTIDTVGVSATIHIVPNRIVLDAGYNLSFSDTDVETTNPSPGNFTVGSDDLMLLNAVAQDWPTIKNRLHEVVVNLAYRFSPNVRVGARYLYESYDLDDFAWNIRPYMAGQSVENSTRYVFSGATYNEYQAHVGTLSVAGSF